MNMDIDLQNIPVESIALRTNLNIDILRLDAIHPEISGNKYFKLINNIKEATEAGYQQIVTLGGAFSNHLHATSYLCSQLGLQSIGIIRGQKVFNPTLIDCSKWGMKFGFTDYFNWVNLNYKQLKENIAAQYPEAFFIPMGGDNLQGVEGFSLLKNYLAPYDVIICSVGTGTTLAGIRKYTKDHQTIIGIQSVKDAKVKANVAFKSGSNNFMLLDNHTFGGFAKFDNNLVDFMRFIFLTFQLKLDFVYTAKSMYALYVGDLDAYIKPSDKVLFIHTGGLQGNRGAEAMNEIFKL